MRCSAPHAEINALNSVKKPELLRESTLYVNLEPCCHHGKTPPCTDRIIAESIPRVVIGMQDPFPKVAGQGISQLRNAGIEVIAGILEADSQWLNRRFTRFNTSSRPYIILKWAQTLDGFIDMERKSDEPHINWITHENTRILVHKWRTEEQAVMVGGNAAANDNPQLTVRDWAGRNPLRVVIDHTGTLSKDLNVFNDEADTFLFTPINKTYGSRTKTIVTDFSVDVLPFVFKTLFENNIQSIIVEGGRHLLSTIIQAGLWDEARIFTGNRYFFKGVKAPEIDGKVKSIEHLGEDVLAFIINDF